jgi:hypothetical protein
MHMQVKKPKVPQYLAHLKLLSELELIIIKHQSTNDLTNLMPNGLASTASWIYVH